MRGAPTPDGSADLQPETSIGGKYRVEHKLGEGGMGAVYAARHEALGVRVAVKVLLPGVSKDSQLVARFVQEARAAARIEGDHIARVFDVGTLESGRPYMVMELLEGEDLGNILHRGPLETGMAVAYVRQALDGIAEAHRMGVVHRDLKPENVFVVRRSGRHDTVKILDFGISKSFEQSAKITSTGSTMGSPAYMSPEQVRSSKDVDARADIWSIGVILYELVTGRLPFYADTVGGTFAAILEKTPEPPTGIPHGLNRIILRCLRRDPAERFQSADELAQALAPYAADQPTSTTPAMKTATDVEGPTLAITPEAIQTNATWGDGRRASPKRSSWLGAILAAALLAAVVGAVAVMSASDPAPAVSVEPASPPTETVAARVSEAPTATSAVSAPPPATASVAPTPRPLVRAQPKASAAPARDLFQRH